METGVGCEVRRHHILGMCMQVGLIQNRGRIQWCRRKEIMVIIMISLGRRGPESHTQVEGLLAFGKSRDASP